MCRISDAQYLVEDRHTRSLGQRLHYAQLADPEQPANPDQPAEPDQCAEPPAASPAAGVGAGQDPPPDRDGLAYSADLLTLAAIPAGDDPASPGNPGHFSPGSPQIRT